MNLNILASPHTRLSRKVSLCGSAAIAVLERGWRESECGWEDALVRVGAANGAVRDNVLLADELLIPSDHRIDPRRWHVEHVGNILECAEAEGEVCLEELVLERGHDAPAHLAVRDLVLGERLVGEDRGDGVVRARDLLLVVLVDAVLHREVGLEVAVVGEDGA